MSGIRENRRLSGDEYPQSIQSLLIPQSPLPSHRLDVPVKRVHPSLSGVPLLVPPSLAPRNNPYTAQEGRRTCPLLEHRVPMSVGTSGDGCPGSDHKVCGP